MKYKHLVITRFNIPARYEGKKNPVLEKVDPKTDETYLDGRMKLFEKYTYPSMENQTNKDFTWVVLFSDQTPQKYVNRLQELGNGRKWFCPLYLTDDEAYNYDAYLYDILKRYKCDQYITTRLDNDDAVSIDLIEKIQTYCNDNDIKDTLISFKYGYQYTQKNNTLSRFYYVQNHFTTLVCSKADKTVISFPHNKIPDYIKKDIIGERNNPIWIEVIRETNFVNQSFFNIKNVIISKKALDRYACNIPWNGRAIIMNFLHSIPGTFRCIVDVLKKKIAK